MSFLTNLLIILQIVVSVLLTTIVVLQSSDEDVLSGLDVGNSKSRFLSHKSSVDLITKITVGLGIVFMLNSFFLVSIYTRQYSKNKKGIVQSYLEETGGEIGTTQDVVKTTD
ncbi:MAG: preprotein translocase subunit SecG [Rickettsiales bacterium]|jgi:protein translocase SecG subunit|nr:preprotein translocase subunit SecG [Rickettsiales bacterium]